MSPTAPIEQYTIHLFRRRVNSWAILGVLARQRLKPNAINKTFRFPNRMREPTTIPFRLPSRWATIHNSFPAPSPLRGGLGEGVFIRKQGQRDFARQLRNDATPISAYIVGTFEQEHAEVTQRLAAETNPDPFSIQAANKQEKLKS